MLKNIGCSGKIFLLGILLGISFCILTRLYLEPIAESTQGFLEAKAGALPTNQALLSLVIFLNNTLIVVLASIGSLALILFVTWGRKNVSLWQKMDESRFSGFLDRYIWGLIKRFKSGFTQIKKKINRDIFVIAYGLPTLVIIINGWFFGFLFASEFLNQQLTGIIVFLKWIAPHGIIEIPAILTSVALGYSFADSLLESLYREETEEVRNKAKKNIKSKRTFRILLTLIILLAIAALIEVFLTPQIV